MEVVLFTEKQVMMSVKNEFSKLFSKWFSILVSESLFARLDDDFSPIIEQQDYEIDYSYLSGGERTAVALAYRLALNQVINSFISKINTKDVVILDEPTAGADIELRHYLWNFLKELNNKGTTIFLTTHYIEEAEKLCDRVGIINKGDMKNLLFY